MYSSRSSSPLARWLAPLLFSVSSWIFAVPVFNIELAGWVISTSASAWWADMAYGERKERFLDPKERPAPISTSSMATAKRQALELADLCDMQVMRAPTIRWELDPSGTKGYVAGKYLCKRNACSTCDPPTRSVNFIDAGGGGASTRNSESTNSYNTDRHDFRWKHGKVNIFNHRIVVTNRHHMYLVIQHRKRTTQATSA